MLQHMEMEYIDQVIKSEIMNYDIKTYIDSGKLPDNYFNDSMNTRYHYIDYEKEPENKNNISMIQSITEPYYYSDHVKDIIHMEHCIHKCDTVQKIYKILFNMNKKKKMKMNVLFVLMNLVKIIMLRQNAIIKHAYLVLLLILN